ncbi:L-2,4-diaminobutyrate decarboxylase [Symmachiella macrocystis]|uniref:L-2,4-diaminobutyrate decarboxylase n=1 Tax=Symmachiella macrocystis TaxID=2527985 RepID=A0A5C6BLQ1_9PLAN|nr:pyridoxal-dependent decarboxylase [Symmachiella macrocystis]TWU12597.1 L-2,4-diaminobutyrate decarboxylase [Symmachiella macrocystis]
MSYLDIVSELQNAFPQPVSDRLHDSYFVFSFMRALDQLDAMKSVKPLLGQPIELDYDSARQRRMEDAPHSVEEVSEELVGYLSGMFIWGHPRSQINVVPSPTIPSVIGGLLPSIYNPNLCSDESARGVVMAELESVAMTADLLGYDPQQAGGFFTFGGTGTTMYGAKIGLEKACPGTMTHGIREPAHLLCSTQAHYACQTVAGWMGLGHQNVVHVPSDPENAIRPCLLETHCRALLDRGEKIAVIVATMGTTDAFGLDDLQTVYDLREQLVSDYDLDYRPHIHADAVIGWAWSVFNDYNFETNPLAFPPRTIRSLAGTRRRIKHLQLADSIGIDFHKTGFTPYVSSLFLCKDAADLQLITRDEETTPYLFQSGKYHPGKYTLETTRSGSGPMAALANLRLFGKDGLRSLLGHLVSMAESLREHLDSHPAIHVLNGKNFGPVTLFRVYPDEVDTFSFPDREQTDARFRDQLLQHNDYNRRIFDLIQDEALQGRGVVLSLTDCYRETDYGEPIVALKSYIMSPFSTEWYAGQVLESVQRAREMVRKECSPQ